jgi:hypothetical protein
MTPPQVLMRAASGRDAWTGIDDASAGARILKAAEKALEA